MLCSFSLSQCCAHFHCNSAVLISLSQRCARFHCHSPVLISLSQCCAHRCLTAIGFLLCTFNYAKHIDGSNSSQKRFVSYSLMIAKQKYPILLQMDAFLHHSATACNWPWLDYQFIMNMLWNLVDVLYNNYNLLSRSRSDVPRRQYSQIPWDSCSGDGKVSSRKDLQYMYYNSSVTFKSCTLIG